MSSFDTIYDTELHYILRSLRRLGIPMRDLEDVAHDVFLVVHEQLDKYDDARPLRPWLFGIAFRVASTYRRKHSNVKERLSETSEGASAEDPKNPWPAHQTRQLVLAALESLELEPRAVIILHDIDGATANEISDTLQMPVNRVYSRLRIARREFRDAALKLQEETP